MPRESQVEKVHGRTSGHDRDRGIPEKLDEIFGSIFRKLHRTRQTPSCYRPRIYCDICMRKMANMGNNGFQDRCFRPLSHPSGRERVYQFRRYQSMSSVLKSKPPSNIDCFEHVFNVKDYRVGFTKGLDRISTESSKLTVSNGDNNCVVCLNVGLLDKRNIK